MREYGLHSEFDIARHKETFVNYLEIMIEEDGHILYATPSHQEKAISLACKKKSVSRKQLASLCQKEFYFDFLTWLLEQSGAIAVWNDFYEGKANEVQKKKLYDLRLAGLYKGKIA